MKRYVGFAAPKWDDPFWHAVRMIVDLAGRRGTIDSKSEIISKLKKLGTESSLGLSAYLQNHPHLLGPIVEYVQLRYDAGNELLSLMRTEEEAKADYATLSNAAIATYGTKSSDHYQSSKVLVATVEVITESEAAKAGLSVNVNPQERSALVAEDHIWVSPRRLDGALPGLFNPVGIWEIKEYWGKTGGGSKMSDAIYECQLVGTELRVFGKQYGSQIYHYVILDGREQWSSRKSDVRRAVDLLYAGLIDELIVGKEVMTEWPRIARYLCDVAIQTGVVSATEQSTLLSSPYGVNEPKPVRPGHVRCRKRT